MLRVRAESNKEAGKNLLGKIRKKLFMIELKQNNKLNLQNPQLLFVAQIKKLY